MSKRMVQNPPHDTGVHVRQAAHDPRQLASSVYPQHILLLCACACLWSSNALAPLQAQTSGINAEPVEQQQATPLESTEQPTMTAVPGIELEGAILKTIDATSLAAQVAGPLRELLVKEGDIVKANQALGKINDDALRLELEQLKTQITVAQKKQANDIDERLAEKSLQVARTEYERAMNANARVPGTYPINEIDRLKLLADRTQLEVERAKYEQELAAFEVTLAQGSYRQTYERFLRHQLAAPAAGVVVSVEKRAGEWVEPGTDLLRIVRIDQLRVEGFISSEEASPQLVGRSARITMADKHVSKTADSQNWQGKVVFVSPDVNPVNSQVRVFIEVDNPNGVLRPGLRVQARIEGPVDGPAEDSVAHRSPPNAEHHEPQVVEK
ncbi:MAG: efflux RND transporter periplasmic adaptor subunit [Planctomycetales bacterium]|nr:efflux RND transporter periplasmic adaptor subunit [Planctomycetales bacterium]